MDIQASLQSRHPTDRQNEFGPFGFSFGDRIETQGRAVELIWCPLEVRCRRVQRPDIEHDPELFILE